MWWLKMHSKQATEVGGVVKQQKMFTLLLPSIEYIQPHMLAKDYQNG